MIIQGLFNPEQTSAQCTLPPDPRGWGLSNRGMYVSFGDELIIEIYTTVNNPSRTPVMYPSA